MTETFLLTLPLARNIFWAAKTHKCVTKWLQLIVGPSLAQNMLNCVFKCISFFFSRFLSFFFFFKNYKIDLLYIGQYIFSVGRWVRGCTGENDSLSSNSCPWGLTIALYFLKKRCLDFECLFFCNFFCLFVYSFFFPSFLFF